MKLSVDSQTLKAFEHLLDVLDLNSNDDEDLDTVLDKAARRIEFLEEKVAELEDEVAELEAPGPEEGRAAQALVHELHGGTPMPNTALCVHPHCVRLHREC